MRHSSEKPTHQTSTRVLIGLLLATLGCAASGKSAKETTGPEPIAKEQEKEEPCEEQLKEAMGLCIDMCRMQSIGAIGGEFDKNDCSKKCENGTSKYPTKLKGLFERCGKKPEKNGQQPYQNPRQKRRYRKRVAQSH